jgi:hypothetical protein
VVRCHQEILARVLRDINVVTPVGFSPEDLAPASRVPSPAPLPAPLPTHSPQVRDGLVFRVRSRAAEAKSALQQVHARRWGGGLGVRCCGFFAIVLLFVQ